MEHKKSPESPYQWVRPLSVVIDCGAPYEMGLLAEVKDKYGKCHKRKFKYTGCTALVDDYNAFDTSGCLIRFGDQVKRILEVTASGAKTDHFLVETTDGNMSYAEVQYSYDDVLRPTLRLKIIGQTCEFIKKLPDGVRAGPFATHYGKMGKDYYLLEGGTGHAVDLPVDFVPEPPIEDFEGENPLEDEFDDDEISPRVAATSTESNPKTRIRVFCSAPLVEQGILCIDAKIGSVVHHLMIDPNYHRACRLQPSNI